MAEEKVTKATQEEASPAAKAKAEKKPAAEKTAKASKAAKTAQNTVVISAKGKAQDAAVSAGSVKITLKKGLMGCSERQKAVVASLGLKRVGDVSIQPDNAPTAGKIAKIGFLLDVSRA